MTKLPTYGRGFARMKKRMGRKGYAANVDQVLADQAAALTGAGSSRVEQPRDRSAYKTYPKPRSKK